MHLQVALVRSIGECLECNGIIISYVRELKLKGPKFKHTDWSELGNWERTTFSLLLSPSHSDLAKSVSKTFRLPLVNLSLPSRSHRQQGHL